jgi:hypothetical protein
MHFAETIQKVSSMAALVVIGWCLMAGAVSGQSTDITRPAGVYTNEVAGTIAARDLGDSRLTDHFFAFTGTPGDLLISVESMNLNGDIDVFTLTGMRPLLKFTVYEGSSPTITKSIYLRKREDLILRIEARTPNDDAGTYRVKFGGSFEPIAGGSDGALSATTDTPSADGTSEKSGKRGSRVNSVGARIYEPPTEVVAAPTPEPEPAAKPAREVTAPKTSSRSNRGRRPATARTRQPAAEKPAGEKPATEADPEAAVKPSTTEKTTAPPTGRRRPGRRNTTARTVEKPQPPQEVEVGPRLIIETNDGTMINRYMTTVRRVTVENGQVVVVGKDGKVERYQLANVVRMSVGP